MDSLMSQWDFYLILFFILIACLAIPVVVFFDYGREHLVAYTCVGVLPLVLFPPFIFVSLILSSIYSKRSRVFIFWVLTMLCLMVSLVSYRSLPTQIDINSFTSRALLYGDTPSIVIADHIRKYSEKVLFSKKVRIGGTYSDFNNAYYRIQTSNSPHSFYVFSSDSSFGNLSPEIFHDREDEKYQVFYGEVMYQKNITSELITSLQSRYPEVTLKNSMFVRKSKQDEYVWLKSGATIAFILFSGLFLVFARNSYRKHY